MKLGRIIGSVMSTQKVETLEGVKLLLLQPLDEELKEAGEPLIATDTVQAGVGDLVMWEVGREGAMALPEPFNPSDAGVMGIVDHVVEDGA